MTQIEERAAVLFERDDADLAADLLARLDVHAGAPRDRLRRWADSALAFGADLAARDGPVEPSSAATIRDAHGGLVPGRILLAEFRSRPATVLLYTDAIEAAEQLIDQLDWRSMFPAGCVRASALAHETAHAALHGPVRRELRHRIGHPGLRIGRWQRLAHVAGSDELAAHGFARERVGLGRSPVLLTAVLGELAAMGSAKEVHRWAS